MFGWFIKTGNRAMTAAKSVGERKFDDAMAQADELFVRTRSVREQLEPYRSADNPLEAIQRATALDGFYENGGSPK